MTEIEILLVLVLLASYSSTHTRRTRARERLSVCSHSCTDWVYTTTMATAVCRDKRPVMSLSRVTDQVTQSTRSSQLFISPDTERVQESTKAWAFPSLLFEPLTRLCVCMFVCWEGMAVWKSGDIRTRLTGQIWHEIRGLRNVWIGISVVHLREF